MIELTLPMPVSTNVYYRNVQGRTIISKAGRLYAQNVWSHVMTYHNHETPLLGRLSLEITLVEPDRRRRDLDNFCGKSLLDAMQKAGVYQDDSQIDLIKIVRGGIEKPGSVKVRIEEINERV